MLSCSIWFSAPSFWTGGGLESRCIGCVYCAGGALQINIETNWSMKILNNTCDLYVPHIGTYVGKLGGCLTVHLPHEII